ncbi:MAG: extracellular solute-binding protein [Phycisphaerae bacterium]|nr:extracellular solute-binding protein [Phycisphaerae bacterium]
MKRSVRWKPLSYVVLLAGAVGLGGLAGCEQKAPLGTDHMPKPPRKLTILTPHGGAIRETFETGFWNWHLEQRKTPVNITWIYRGTPQCVEYMRAAGGGVSEGERYTRADLMFGGGLSDHGKLAAEGFARAVDLGGALAEIPGDVHGTPTRDAQGRWFVTGLSSFGIVYNERACAQRGITPPTTWDDLADPRFYGWVAVADPLASGSHLECLILVVQHKGWADGWGTIIRILANARALNARSGDALRQVRAGTALATFAVNFDGMALAAESAGALKYIDPPGATAASLDIISVLSTASDIELAKDFVRYVLSEEGQALWGVIREHRAPYGETLYHYPIAPSVYEKYADHLAVAQNPLQVEFGLQVDPDQTTRWGSLLKPLVRAVCDEGNHVRLQQAWRAVIDAHLPPEALAELTAPPFDEQATPELSARFQAADTPELRQQVDEWTALFSRKYAQILEMSKR